MNGQTQGLPDDGTKISIGCRGEPRVHPDNPVKLELLQGDKKN